MERVMSVLRQIFLILAVIFFSGCNGSGNLLMVRNITGPDSIIENSTVEFSVDATGDTGITYAWISNPVGTGTFGTPDSASTTFTAPEVDADLEIVIRVLLNSDNDGPVVRSIDVAIENSPDDNHPPVAAAKVEPATAEPDFEIQFTDLSTDPDSPDDIEKWEWDFTYDPVDGFSSDSQVRNPLYAYDIPGEYFVQLRVTDSGGLSDLLDFPLTINIVEGNISPVAQASFEYTGSYDGFEVNFENTSYDPNPNDEITRYEWDFSYDELDGFIQESEEVEPSIFLADLGTYQFQLRVTDTHGATGMLEVPLELEVTEWGWTAAFPSSNPFEIYDICFDDLGNFYTCGRFEVSIDLDPGQDTWILNEPAHDLGDTAFIAKYSEAGEVLWGIPIPGLITSQILCDSSGDLFVIGDYKIGGDIVPEPSLEHSSGTCKIILKVDSAGIVVSQYYNEESCYFIENQEPQMEYSESLSYVYLDLYVAPTSEVYLLRSRFWYAGYAGSPSCSSSRIIIKFDNNLDITDSLLFDEKNNSDYTFLSGSNGTIDVLDSTVIHRYSPDLTPILETPLTWDPLLKLPSGFFTGITGDLVVSTTVGHVAGFDNTGANLWAAHWYEGFYLPVMAGGSDGSIFTAGQVKGEVDFDPGPGELLEGLAPNILSYVNVLASDGNLLWHNDWGLGSKITTKNIDVNNDGWILLSGYFQTHAVLDPSQNMQEFYTEGDFNSFLILIPPGGY